MSKQKHDPGHKKRAITTEVRDNTSPEHHARELVRRGLATKQILDNRTAQPHGGHRKTVTS